MSLTFRSCLAAAALCCGVLHALPTHAQLKLPRPSPTATVSQVVGVTEVTVRYARPSVRGRPVFGGLVPFGQVWRTGANEATTVEFSTDVKVEGQPLPAGRYSLHSIPTATEWTLIFNTVAEQWGSYSYDEKKDALRVKVVPTEGPPTELLTFGFPDVSTDAARVELAWDKVRVGFRVQADTPGLTQKGIAETMARYDDWRTPMRAAEYALSANLPTADALRWIDRSIAAKETFANLAIKARLLARDGKNKDAVALADRAVKMGKANGVDAAETAALEKESAAWKAAPRK